MKNIREIQVWTHYNNEKFGTIGWEGRKLKTHCGRRAIFMRATATAESTFMKQLLNENYVFS